MTCDPARTGLKGRHLQPGASGPSGKGARLPFRLTHSPRALDRPKWLVMKEFSSGLAGRRFDTPTLLLYTSCFVRASFSLVVAGRRRLHPRGSEQLEGSSLPEQSKTEWKRRAAGYGTPVPQSRVSLSESKPRAGFCLLECVRSFLLVSPDSQCTFQRSVCAR